MTITWDDDGSTLAYINKTVMLYITRYFYFYFCFFCKNMRIVLDLRCASRFMPFLRLWPTLMSLLLGFGGKIYGGSYICSGNLKTIVHVTTSKNFTRLNLRVKFLFVMTWRISDVHFLSNDSVRIFTTYVVYTIYFPRFRGVCSRVGVGYCILEAVGQCC